MTAICENDFRFRLGTVMCIKTTVNERENIYSVYCFFFFLFLFVVVSGVALHIRSFISSLNSSDNFYKSRKMHLKEYFDSVVGHIHS